MRAYIKKLQSKTEETRKLIFMTSLIVTMSVVSFIWIYSLSDRLGDKEVKLQANEDIKPFKLFTNSISNTFKNTSASVGKISSNKKEIKEESSTEPEKQIDLIPVEYTNQ